MKTALIIESIIIVALVVLIAIKWRKWTVSEGRVAKFETHPGDIPLDRHVLEELGFKIYDTKDQLYALHPNGLSMTYMEGAEWVIEYPKRRKIKHIYNVHELVLFAQEQDKQINVKDQSK